MKTKRLLWLLAFTLDPTLTRSQAVTVVLPMLGGERTDAVRYVGGSAARDGEDIGAQINEAYASLPSSGGRIVVVADPNGDCYRFLTPIVAAVPGKYLLLEGGSLASRIVTAVPTACLNYIPTTASSAITLDYVVPGQSASLGIHGIRNLTMTNNRCETLGGCGSDATAITLGGVNGGAQGATFEGLRVIGFGTALNVLSSRSNSGELAFHHCTLSYNATGFIDTQGDAEHISLDACHFQGNGTGVTSSASVTISSSTLDSNAVLGVNCSSPAACDLNENHFENDYADTTHFLSGTGVFSVIGGDMRDDRTSGNTDWWMNFAGASFLVLGTTLTTGGRTANSVILNQGPGNALIQNNSSDKLPNIYSNPQLLGSTQPVSGLENGSGASESTLGQPIVSPSATNPAVFKATDTIFTDGNTHIGTETSARSLKPDATEPGIIIANGVTYPCTSFTSTVAAGGIVDARGCTGTNSVRANPLPSPTKPGILYLGNATFQTTATWTALQGLSIFGSGIGSTGFGPTSIQAVAGFPASSPVLQISGSNAIRVEALGVDCNNQSGVIGIQIDDSEEMTGLRHVNVQGCPNIGILIGDGTAGHSQNSGPYEDLYVLPGNARTSKSTVPVKVNVKSQAFRGIHGMTIDFHTASPSPTNCMTISTSGSYSDIHIEGCTNGINVTATGVQLSNIECASTVINCVVFTSGSGNFAWNIQTTGTNLIVDSLHSLTLAASSYGNTWPFYYQANTAQGTGGFFFDRITVPEGSAPGQGPAAGLDFCYGDSTAHALKCYYNNGQPGQVVLDNATQTLANKTLSSPVLTQASGSLNGVTGSLSSPTIVSPVLNGVSTGTGVQGSDPKLLTSDKVSGIGSPLCLDANGGATTNGCGGGAIQVTRSGPSCVTGNNSYDYCTNRLAWPNAFSNTNYAVTCTGIGPSNPRANITIAMRWPNAVAVNVVTYGSVAVSFSEIDCTAVPDPASVNGESVTAPANPPQTPVRPTPVGSHPTIREE
jgi:hypothetical protein